MKSWIVGALVAAVVAVSFAPTPADAKRFGGGGSAGMQRSQPPRAAPDAVPAKPAAPTQAAPATAGTGAAAATPKRSWMGPIAGLAAGLGIAALMSHLGMGEAFGNFLMLALLAVVAVVAIRFLMRRFAGGGGSQAYAGAGAAGGSTSAQVAWPRQAEPAAAPLQQRAAEASGPSAAQPMSNVPAGFDAPGFERIAKLIFIRLQAANDAADLNDLRQFTTPELFAAARLDLQERGDTRQQTDVLKVDAQVLEVAQDGPNQVVSVRFSGLIREQSEAAANDFDEVWHMVKPSGDDSRPWAIAGIQQRQ